MKIQELLNQVKPCWKYAATDKDGTIVFYSARPVMGENCWMCQANIEHCIYIYEYLDRFFDIESFDGDWKDSLIEREE